VTALSCVTCPSAIGELVLVGSDAGLRSVHWERGDEAPDTVEGTCDVLEAARGQLQAYLRGELVRFDVPLDLVGTEFQLAAWRALAEIPYGQTTTYSAQARRIGRPLAARAVGAANGRNPVPIVLPCHRVVGASGGLVGFGGGLERKAWLLEHEARVTETTVCRRRPPAAPP
jgi:methylated-DNA-[protein]-cysteine S-methyltransferase